MRTLAEINWTALFGAGSLGVVVSAITGYILAARKMSGKIGTSDADDLWSEARNIRDDYRLQLIQANERTLNVERRVANVEGQNNELTASNLKLRDELEACKELARVLRSAIDSLEAKQKESE